MQRFDGKVALITGAASGIGLASARRLAREGARVFACDVNVGQLQAEVAALAAEGLQVKAHALDVADVAACGAAVAAAVAAFGRLDVLGNIAGIGQCQHFGEIEQATWDKVMAIHITGVFAMCQAAMPHLLESKGNIVNISSVAGLVGLPYSAAYCASKGAVLLLTKSLATEFAGRGVRVNAICPGGVTTPLSKSFVMPADIDMGLMGRMTALTPETFTDPSEIAASLAYLASDEARFVTGTGFVIDGGQTAI
jgi:meso-butanediol dehydrogenase/(S,S)-butanediol dehydrogenase/diacetyl reductase